MRQGGVFVIQEPQGVFSGWLFAFQVLKEYSECMINFFTHTDVDNSDHKLRVIPEESRLKASDIARLYGVSASRVRQLTGTRHEPLETFGSPLKLEGERGYTWQTRRVYQYALEHGIRIKDMPALLPSMEGKQLRYEPDNYKTGVYSYRGKGSQDLRDVWVFVFKERNAYDSRPHSIHLAVPLEADDTFMTGTGFYELCQQEGWFGKVDDDYSIFGVLPVGVKSSLYLHVSICDSRGNVASASIYRDLLQCIGWERFPAWGEGLATSSLLAQWKPGQPPTTVLPTAVSNLWALYAYALKHAKEDNEIQRSWLELARAVWEIGIKGWARDAQYEDLSDNEYFEWGVKIDLLPQPEIEDTEGSGVSYHAALEEIMASAETPAYIAETAIGYMGDHSYSHPATILWEEMPNEWVKKLQETGEKIPQGNEMHRAGRVACMARAFQKSFPRYLAQDLRVLPQGMAFICGVGMVYISSLGYSEERKTFEEDLASTWPSNAHKVLIHKSSLSSRLAVWVMTIEGQVMPIATSAPWLADSVQMLARAAGRIRHYSEHLSSSANIYQLLHRMKPGDVYELSAHDFVDLF